MKKLMFHVGAWLMVKSGHTKADALIEANLKITQLQVKLGKMAASRCA